MPWLLCSWFICLGERKQEETKWLKSCCFAIMPCALTQKLKTVRYGGALSKRRLPAQGLWWHTVSHNRCIWSLGCALLSLVPVKNKESDHPVSVHGRLTWLEFRVTEQSAWGMTPWSASIKARERWAKSQTLSSHCLLCFNRFCSLLILRPKSSLFVFYFTLRPILKFTTIYWRSNLPYLKGAACP